MAKMKIKRIRTKRGMRCVRVLKSGQYRFVKCRGKGRGKRR